MQGGTGSQKAPTLVIAFNCSWCSSGTEGSVTDTHVHYFLFDLILDEQKWGMISIKNNARGVKKDLLRCTRKYQVLNT